MGVSYLDYRDWKENTRTFDAFGAYNGTIANVSDEGQPPERYNGVAHHRQRASRSSARAPVIGRDFVPDDDRRGAPAVVLIGHSVWSEPLRQQSIGDRPDRSHQRHPDHDHRRDAGRLQVSVQHRSLDAAAARSPDLEEQKRNTRPLQAFGHLAPGVTREQAQSELINISQKLESENPDTNKDIQARVQTFNEQPERRADPHGVPVADGRGRVRAADRVRERRQPAAVARHQPRARDLGARVARRVALARDPAAADRKRAARGRSAASAASASPRSASACSIAPRRTSAGRTGSSSRWTAPCSRFFALVCLGTGIIFGLAPALHVSKTDVNEVLKEGGRSGTRRRARAPLDRRADGRRAGAHRRAARRRRLHDAQLRDAVPPRPRHRHVEAADDGAGAAGAEVSRRSNSAWRSTSGSRSG